VYVLTRTSELARIKLPEERTEVRGGRCARLNARNSPNRVSRALMGDGISPGAVNPQQQQQQQHSDISLDRVGGEKGRASRTEYVFRALSIMTTQPVNIGRYIK